MMRELLRKYLALRLAVIGAGLLIYWQITGSPFSTWIAFSHTASSLDMALLTSLLSLAGKLLFTLAGWGLLAGLIVRELALAIRSSQKSSQQVSAVAPQRDRAPSRMEPASSLPLSRVKQMPPLPKTFFNDSDVDTASDPCIKLNGALEVQNLYASEQMVALNRANALTPVGNHLRKRGSSGRNHHAGERGTQQDEERMEQTQEFEVKSSQAEVDTPPGIPSVKKGDPRVHAVSHTGIVRAHKPNEDSYIHLTVKRQLPGGTQQWAGLFLVADGMGGYNHGKYASTFVVESIRADIEPILSSPQYSEKDLKERFIAAVRQANTRLYTDNETNHRFCGTTLTGMILLEQTQPGVDQPASKSYVGHVINIGDSRTYQFSHTKGLQRITCDHSTVEKLIEMGAISPEERYTDRRRNQIYRCIGQKEELEIDTFTVTLHPHECLLLCSDGLWEMVRDTELATLLSNTQHDPSHTTSQLLQASLKQGGEDNITALLVASPGDEE